MPELPEVETIVRDLRPALIGRTLTNPRLHRTDMLRQVSRARLLRTLARNTIVAVDRRAKHVVIGLDSGHRLVIQPRMTGSLIVHHRRPSGEERRYAILQVSLGRGSQLVYRDVRRLGTIWLLDERGWQTYSDRLGPEPLDPAFNSVAFAQRFSGSRQAIKKAIMDQRRLAGVGNIYANEALFRARIDPSRRADRLTARDYEALFDAVRAILGDAVAARGTTVRDYRTGTGQRGSFQAGLEVYGRGGEPCVRCDTSLVTTHAIDGRATTWCWQCQRGRRPARQS